MKKVKTEIKKAIEAVEKEIKAVQERPSHEVLNNGELAKNVEGDGEHYYYRFPTRNQSIQYAETIETAIGGKTYKSKPHQFDEDGIVLEFEDQLEGEPDRAELEWINDFVLRRLQDELQILVDAKEDKLENIEAVFHPVDETADEFPDIFDDGRRNDAQYTAIQKAVHNRVLFIWGPPGTGKTSTLGYIIANLLKEGKRVLFASNTNRAVDIGMISVIDALQTAGENRLISKITRYGELALEGESLDAIHFENLMESRRNEQKRQQSEIKNLVDRYKKLKKNQDGAEGNEEESGPGTKQKNEFKLLEQQVKRRGGLEALELELEVSETANYHSELKKFDVIGTTLAKVCTSEHFGTMSFDAVVVDEASMANLPYLFVLAAKAEEHMVAVGDPMQLPPIAVTDDWKAKDYLEEDIFTYVSGAESTGDLFRWHDEHPDITAFFDVQYRLKSELAGMISSVFYENRLKTAESLQKKSEMSGQSVFLLDSARMNPHLTQNREGRGYRPRNECHLQIIRKLSHKLVMQELVPTKEIGIIVPFRSCVYDIRELLYGQGLKGIEVGTIHTFQGRQKQVIVFDTVMSGEKHARGQRHYSVRPFDEAKNGLSVHRLLNVAFSRTQSHLYVLADMNHINHVYDSKFLGRLLRTMSEKQQHVSLSPAVIS